jgi:solute carrier family 45 protein 1/2/4
MWTVCIPFNPTYIMLRTLYSPWAMYGWAPLAIMGEEINKLESAANTQTAYTTITQDGEETELSRPGSLDLSHDDNTLVEGQGDSVGVAGVYLGIWNIFATIPQFIATFIAMITFAILEPGKNSELTGGPGGPDGGDGADKVIAQGLSGTAVCLAIGAVCSLVAATQSFRLRKY